MAPRSLIVAILVLLLMTAICPSVLASVGGPMPLKPTLMISALDPQSIIVEVSATSLGTATFHATVTVDKPPAIGTVMVQLDANTDTDWPTIVVPSNIPFTSPGTIQITVTVNVPEATSSTLIGKVTVTGTATYPGGMAEASSSGTVTVKQYYLCTLRPPNLLGTDNPQTFGIVVKNSGNGEDSFEISLPFQEAIAKAGLSVSFDKTTTGKLAQDVNFTIHMTVSYGPSAAAGKKQIYVRATSTGSKSGGNDTYYADTIITIDVQPWHGSAGISLGAVALVIIIIVVVMLYAKKKGKLRFKRKPKPAPVKVETKEQKEK